MASLEEVGVLSSSKSRGSVGTRASSKEDITEVKSIRELEVKMLVEAQDKYGKWFLANIINIDSEENKVLVHFKGWSDRFNEWVGITDNRIRKIHITTMGVANKSFNIGDIVQAKWEDGKLYNGAIVGIFDIDHVKVLFNDGVHYNVSIDDIRKKKSFRQKLVTKKQDITQTEEEELGEGSEMKHGRVKKSLINKNIYESQSDNLDNSSPPSSPVSGRRKRKRHSSRNHISDDDYELSSNNDSDVSSATEDISPPTRSKRGRRKSSVTISRKSQRVMTPDTSSTPKEPSERVIKKRTSQISSLNVTPIRASPPEHLNLAGRDTIGPLVTPPTHHMVTPTPISLITTAPHTIIQTHSHTISGIELLPSMTGSARTHVATVEATPLMFDNTPPIVTPPITTSTGNVKQGNRRGRPPKSRPPLLTPPTNQEGKKETVSMTTRTQKKAEKNIIKSDRERPSHLAPKEHVIIWDHNKFKCTVPKCTKSFRKESLLQSHLRHYHKQTSPQKGIKKTPTDKRLHSNTPSKEACPVENAPPTSSDTPIIRKSPKSRLLVPKKCLKTSPKMGGVKNVAVNMIIVPSELPAKKIYEELKIPVPEPVEIKRTQQEEPTHVPQREGLRPIRKTSTVVQEIETESEEMEETTEEEVTSGEEEEDEDFVTSEGGKRKRIASKDDVVHCSCSNDLDEGFMIQCDQCLTWQHGECVGIMEDVTPDSYLCLICSNPPGVRKRIKQLCPRMWFIDGSLPVFSENEKRNNDKGNEEDNSSKKSSVIKCRRKAVLRAHKLSDVLYKIKKMVHCTKIKLQAINSSNHLYLKQWSRHCKELPLSEIESILMKALSPVINQIPLPSNSNNNDSPVTTSESCDTSHDLVPIGEQFLNESFPDVKNLQLLPLPPLPPPPTSSSCRQEVSIDSPPGSPLSQDLPPLPAPVVTTPLPVKQEIDGGSNEEYLSNGSTKVESTVTLRGGEERGRENGHSSSRDVELMNAIRQAAESVTEGEGGNKWLQRLLLVQHVDQVQQKIVLWMDEIDKQIEGLTGKELIESEDLLLQVHQTIRELEKIRQECTS